MKAYFPSAKIMQAEYFHNNGFLEDYVMNLKNVFWGKKETTIYSDVGGDTILMNSRKLVINI